MKFRMLILAVAVMAFASLSFGQGAAFTFLWSNLESAGWYELTYCDTPPEGPNDVVLKDGTIVRLYRDMDYGFGTDCIYSPADQWIPIGDQGVNGEVTINEWTFNSATLPRATGSFLSPVLQYMGAMPAFQPIYLVAGCMVEEVFQPMWASQGFLVQGSPSAFILNCPGGTWGKPCWCRIGCCDAPPPDCVPTPSPFVIDETPGGHGSYTEPDQPEYYCLDLCVGYDLEVQIGPLAEDEFPIVNIMPRCDHGLEGCFDDPCEGATFGYDPMLWAWDPVDGMFKNVISVITEGCVCLMLDDILPAELMGFDARALDREVELTWSTASETDIDAFEVVRDGETVHAVDAAGAGSYTWMDTNLNNGRTYSYELVSVSISGVREVVASTEATPLANLAVITEYALHQNFPNPFNPTTSIVFDVVEDNHVTLTVYNAMGQEVATLANGLYGNGRHNVEFSSDNLTSGLYFYTVKIGNEFTATKKMLLVK
ncbi:T9SS type A sorting domain-containing protein [bacterium]|nr:T9SS type A sorting domain-containing protein [bacterium]MBU1638563.1 T9SS type A sorting domain-containing protein [bacterium]